MKATYWLILACLAVFIAEVLVPSLAEALAFSAAGFGSRPWVIITSIFAHADVIHLLSNVLVLFFFGLAVESEVGPARMLAVFFAGAFAGDAVSVLVYAPDVLSLGASAGVFALVGMGMLVRPLDWSISPALVPLPLVLMGMLYAVYNAFGFISGPANISYAAHFGGLAVGLAAGSHYRGWKKKGLLAVALLLAVLLAIPAVLLLVAAK
jgi:membrane associated rhomboid family serine protease